MALRQVHDGIVELLEGRYERGEAETIARELSEGRYTHDYALDLGRAEAIVTREEQFLEVDIEQRAYTPPGGKTVQLPDAVDITLTTASMDILSDSRGRIRFYPDGSSTGGEIKLLAGDRLWRISVGWLTGEITLETGRT